MLAFLIFVFLLKTPYSLDAFNLDSEQAIVHQPSFARHSHFGRTVSGYQVSSAGQPWLIIGAPLASRERYHNNQWVSSREGAIYRCRVDRPNSCYLLPFDTKSDWAEARDQFGDYYSENRTGQLLGATLQVAGDVVMACAPNYRYVARNPFREEPTGLCLVLRDQFRKFEEHSPCRNSLWGHHRQGYCQAGFSAAIAGNDSSLFLGGPGAWYWQGMVFSISLFNKDVQHRFPDKSADSKFDDSYRGYALHTGHFDNDIYQDVIVSSPRGNDLKGSVEIFSSRFRLLHTFHGTQMGAYFGFSLSCLDLNNDRHDDLIIGSPMYRSESSSHNHFDMGRVDIYIRSQHQKNTNEFRFRHSYIIGTEPRARFGHTIANVGDLDQDGFNDVAIAAPYGGTENAGVVYIFRGNSQGLDPIPAQVIHGKRFNLQTFGHALSGGLDLDGNGYPDLVVGAYQSDAAVLVRSRPVVRGKISVETTPRLVDLKDPQAYCQADEKQTCMNLEVCGAYEGVQLPSSMKMEVRLELDIGKNGSMRRAFFNETGTFLLSHNYTFQRDKKACFNHVIHVPKAIRDKFNPIDLTASLYLNPTTTFTYSLTPLFPLGENHLKHTHSIRFLRNCGSDDLCTPDLKLTASSPSLSHLYGSDDAIDLNVKVLNAAEDAFEAQCIISLPRGVDYVKAFIDRHASLPCTHNKTEVEPYRETTLVCDIGNPLVAGASKNFTIRVSPQKILLNQDKLKFNITVTSSNPETIESQLDNEKYIYVVMKAQPAMALVGKQYQEQVVYETRKYKTNDMILNEKEIGPEVIHEYKLLNKGPSQVSLSELFITWQKATADQRHFLYLMEVPYTEGPISCHISPSLINSLNISTDATDLLSNPEKYYPTSSALKVKRSHPSSHLFTKPKSVPNHRLFFETDCSFRLSTPDEDTKETQYLVNRNNRVINLGTTASGLHCGWLACSVGELGRDDSALIRLRFRLWSTDLAEKPDVYHARTYALSAVTEMPYKKVDLNLEQLRSTAQINTLAYPKQRLQFLDQLNLRIVILSVSAGIGLLLCLVILLWSCGFFKRLIPQPDSSESQSHTTTSDDDPNNRPNEVVDISKSTNQEAKVNPLYLTDETEPIIQTEFSIYSSPRRLNNIQINKETNRQHEFEKACHLNYAEPGVIDRDDGQFSTFQSPIGLRMQRERLGVIPKVDVRNYNVNYGPNITDSRILNTAHESLQNHIQSTSPRLPLLSPALSDVNSTRESPRPDEFTTKLPPVPRRNSKSSLHGRNRTMSPKQQHQIIRSPSHPYQHPSSNFYQKI